ncbi:MAG: hypothetical protein JWR69_4015 [Pedosphaera sp.]|nr:hypothetical protein [Pedosphaera sp.]
MKTLKAEWPQILVLAAPFLAAALFWNQIPARMPVHWNAQWQIDGYANKTFAVLFLPCLNLGVAALIGVLPAIDPKIRKYDEATRASVRRVARAIRLALTAFLTVLQLAIVAIECETVGGLYAQMVVPQDGSAMFEVPYSDGDYASDKADTTANSLLDMQFVYRKGSWVSYPTPNGSGIFPAAVALNGLIDRVSLELSPSGCKQIVEFASERARTTFIPERDFDRNAKAKTLFSGQKELRYESKMALLKSAALRSNPKQITNLTDAYRAQFPNTVTVIT